MCQLNIYIFFIEYSRVKDRNYIKRKSPLHIDQQKQTKLLASIPNLQTYMYMQAICYV